MGFLPFNSNPQSEEDVRENDGSMVYLNVYDLTPMNNYFYMFGVGIYHSGIEVHGMEYGFGAHEFPTSGVFEVEPRSCPGFTFRQSVILGTTDMSISEFRCFLEALAIKYCGDTYHLISKNCNHFTDEVCQQLTGKPIPAWVNRLARVGSFCNCLLPESLQVASSHIPERLAYSDDGESDAGGLTSSGESDSDDDGAGRNLLTTASDLGEVVFVSEDPVRLARELL